MYYLNICVLIFLLTTLVISDDNTMLHKTYLDMDKEFTLVIFDGKNKCMTALVRKRNNHIVNFDDTGRTLLEAVDNPKFRVHMRDDLSNDQSLLMKCIKSSQIESRISKRNTDENRRINYKIFPGTKWCGKGNVAKDYSDLGREIEADQCCRTHDNCQSYIRAGETRFGFKNTLPFTLNSCECDDKFYLCLRMADTVAANKIGALFFNIIKMQCFQRELQNVCDSWYIPNMWCRSYKYKVVVQVYNAQKWNR